MEEVDVRGAQGFGRVSLPQRTLQEPSGLLPLASAPAASPTDTPPSHLLVVTAFNHLPSGVESPSRQGPWVVSAHSRPYSALGGMNVSSHFWGLTSSPGAPPVMTTQSSLTEGRPWGRGQHPDLHDRSH